MKDKYGYQLHSTCKRPLIIEANLLQLRKNWIKWGIYALLGSAAGAILGALALPLLGFGAAGVTAGSFAASWQGPATMAGSVFAICQSLGATGLGILLFGATGSVIGGVGALGLIYKYREKLNWCCCDNAPTSNQTKHKIFRPPVVKKWTSQTLNELKPRPVSDFVSIEGPPNDLGVIIRPDYSDHPLVVGPRYQPDDIRLSYATILGRRTSGVLVMGINYGTKLARKFHEARALRTFRIKGRLGETSENMHADGKVIGKASFDHVKRHHLEKVLAYFQASHQKQMFLQSGVDMQSQTAYELATKGLMRPSERNVPLIYNFTTVDFEPPEFTIEIQCINEYEDYLLNIIHNIGQRLRTLALCTGVQCIRHGPFTTEHSLLRKHWTAEHIVNNIAQCQRVMREAQFSLEHQPFLVNSKEEKAVAS